MQHRVEHTLRVKWCPLNKYCLTEANMCTGEQTNAHTGHWSPITELFGSQAAVWHGPPFSPSVSLASVPQHLPLPSFPLLSSAEKIRNAGTHCHSGLLPPPFTPLTWASIGDFSATDKAGRCLTVEQMDLSSQKKVQEWMSKPLFVKKKINKWIKEMYLIDLYFSKQTQSNYI